MTDAKEGDPALKNQKGVLIWKIHKEGDFKKTHTHKKQSLNEKHTKKSIWKKNTIEIVFNYSHVTIHQQESLNEKDTRTSL